MQQLSFDDLLLPRAERAGRSRPASLFDQITDFGNLYAAYKAAAAGKHDRGAVLRHDLHAEKILWRLRWQLRTGHYRHGGYYRFTVLDPKPRDVAAAPFTDRIVHHAIVRVIEPLFEPGFVQDSYACRAGKGSHKAALRLQHFLRSLHDQHGPEFYVLRTDIRKFFASVDHRVLANRLAARVKDNRTRQLLAIIIGSYQEASPKAGGGGLSPPVPAAGIPIGNLTSQLFANIYLDAFDQFVKHQLGARYYLRYMDDALLLHPSKARLREWQSAIRQFCAEELHLELHAKKTNIHKFSGSERFVGYDLQLHRRRLSKPTVRRFMKRMRRLQAAQGKAAAADSWQQFRAYSEFAHARGLLADIDPFCRSP